MTNPGKVNVYSTNGMHMKCFFLALLSVFFFLGHLASAADHPNILLILADDFGWGDASCNNPEAAFRTPNIDRIANEGMRFTNAHTPHSVCTPTRYALLTGRYAWRTELREGVRVMANR